MARQWSDLGVEPAAMREDIRPPRRARASCSPTAKTVSESFWILDWVSNPSLASAARERANLMRSRASFSRGRSASSGREEEERWEARRAESAERSEERDENDSDCAADASLSFRACAAYAARTAAWSAAWRRTAARRADGGGEERAEEAGAEERRKERAARRSSVSSAAKAARRGADGRNARPPAIGNGAADADWERGGGVEWGKRVADLS